MQPAAVVRVSVSVMGWHKSTVGDQQHGLSDDERTTAAVMRCALRRSFHQQTAVRSLRRGSHFSLDCVTHCVELTTNPAHLAREAIPTSRALIQRATSFLQHVHAPGKGEPLCLSCGWRLRVSLLIFHCGA